MDGPGPAGRRQPLWWTLRRPFRPLSYHAVHRMFERAARAGRERDAARAATHGCLPDGRGPGAAADRRAVGAGPRAADHHAALPDAPPGGRDPPDARPSRRAGQAPAARPAPVPRRATSPRRWRSCSGGRLVSAAAAQRGRPRRRPRSERRPPTSAVGRPACATASRRARERTGPGPAAAARGRAGWPACPPWAGDRRPTGTARSGPRARRAAGLAAGPARHDLAGTVAGQRRGPGGRPGWRDVPRRWLLRAAGRRPAYWLALALSVALRAAAIAPISSARPCAGCSAGGQPSTYSPRPWRRSGTRRASPGCEGCWTPIPSCRPVARRLTVHRAAVIVAAKGGTLGDVTIGDCSELRRRGTSRRSPARDAGHLRALRAMGIIDAAAPPPSGSCAPHGPRTPEQMIDRYHLACQPVRDLLVDYLRERQPALDYSTLQRSATSWASCSGPTSSSTTPASPASHLPDDVARAWKQRLQVKDGLRRRPPRRAPSASAPATASPPSAPSTSTSPSGRWTTRPAGRSGQCPARSARRRSAGRKDRRHRKSRMDARTRERLPVLPALASAVDRQRRTPPPSSRPHRQARPGQEFTAAGQTLVRLPPRPRSPLKVWAPTPPPASAPT